MNRFQYSPLADGGMTEFVITYIRKNRELFLNLVNSLSVEQLNKIPEGFKNNIAWNFGHIIVTAPVLCYIRSGVDINFDIPFRLKYGKDTKPESYISEEEIDGFKQRLISSIDIIETDMHNNIFKNILPVNTATYNCEMHSIEEIMPCILAHDALHYGYALAQRKLVV